MRILYNVYLASYNDVMYKNEKNICYSFFVIHIFVFVFITSCNNRYIINETFNIEQSCKENRNCLLKLWVMNLLTTREDDEYYLLYSFRYNFIMMILPFCRNILCIDAGVFVYS